MHNLLVKLMTTNGLFFALSVGGFYLSKYRSKVEAVFLCVAVGTLLLGVVLVLACVWTG